MPTPPRPTTITVSPGPWASRIDHRAAAGQHGAPEQRRDLRGDVRRNGHDRPTVDDRVGRETGDPEVVMNRCPSRESLRSPVIRVPAALAALPGTHGVSPLVAHASQAPHLGKRVQ